MKERRWEILWAHELGRAIDQLAPILSESLPLAARDTRIHAARKSIKKLRTTLRLFREAFPVGLTWEINRSLRHSARTLGLLRDQKILRKTLLEVARKAEIKPPKASPPLPFRHPIADAIRHLLAVQKGSGQLEWRNVDRALMRRGLKRLDRRCKRAMIQADRKRSDARLHAWRKRTKDLAYALHLIGAKTSPSEEKALRLEHLLGNDHDLALLQKAPPARSKKNALRSVAKAKRRNYQEKAFCLGHLLFSRNAKGS